MSWMPEGTVYGVLLNFQNEVEALAPQMHQPPDKAQLGGYVLMNDLPIAHASFFRPPGSCTRPAAVKTADHVDADYGPLARFEFSFL